MVQLKTAGVGSVPLPLVARTWKLCEPRFCDPYDFGEVQAANTPLSSLHSNVAPPGTEWNVNVDAVEVVEQPDDAHGPESITVSGGPAAAVTVQL